MRRAGRAGPDAHGQLQPHQRHPREDPHPVARGRAGVLAGDGGGARLQLDGLLQPGHRGGPGRPDEPPLVDVDRHQRRGDALVGRDDHAGDRRHRGRLWLLPVQHLALPLRHPGPHQRLQVLQSRAEVGEHPQGARESIQRRRDGAQGDGGQPAQGPGQHAQARQERADGGHGAPIAQEQERLELELRDGPGPDEHGRVHLCAGGHGHGRLQRRRPPQVVAAGAEQDHPEHRQRHPPVVQPHGRAVLAALARELPRPDEP